MVVGLVESDRGFEFELELASADNDGLGLEAIRCLHTAGDRTRSRSSATSRSESCTTSPALREVGRVSAPASAVSAALASASCVAASAALLYLLLLLLR